MTQYIKSPKQQILNSSELKEIADKNFIFKKIGSKILKLNLVENTVGKGENACYEQFLFPAVFSKDLNCRQVKTRACFGKG